MVDVDSELAEIGRSVATQFETAKRVLSFGEYVHLLFASPKRFTRDSASYLRDCFEHFGTETVTRPWGPETRYKLFDQPFSSKRDSLRGHERLQAEFLSLVEGFVRGGRPDRLILLHGPNGSAKTTFITCVMRALEAYSRTDEGALYRFSWIFPRGSDGKRLGFGVEAKDAKPGDSYAHLPDERIAAKLPSVVHEHPLSLLPIAAREKLIGKAMPEDSRVPSWISEGQLGATSKAIFDALLTAYRGRLDQVLAHVQVERYFISRRYRRGAVTIGPEMAVDARERQLTADRTLGSLPASLSALTLYEPFGELVDASGGVLEFSDMLKRPFDAWKYLLLAIETGEVSLGMSTLPLNTVMIASSNELLLKAFREHHEFPSFRGRLRLIRVPYLLDYREEQEIYDSQIVPQLTKHVAPHATRAAALWAVLTRLERPNSDRYEDTALGRIAASLSPLEKAKLYADGTIPERLGADDAKVLKSDLAKVRYETGADNVYEGLFGASARELRNLLVDAAGDEAYEHVSPLAVLARIEALCERGDHAFLKRESSHGYHDSEALIGVVRDDWLDCVDRDVWAVSGLVEDEQYGEMFERYVTHATYYVRKEQLLNELTGQYEDPSTSLLESVEERLGIDEDDRESFRGDLMSKLGAYALDHPGKKAQPIEVFPEFIKKLRAFDLTERRGQVRDQLRDVISVIDTTPLEEERRQSAANALERLKQEFGYTQASAREAVTALLTHRYEG